MYYVCQLPDASRDDSVLLFHQRWPNGSQKMISNKYSPRIWAFYLVNIQAPKIIFIKYMKQSSLFGIGPKNANTTFQNQRSTDYKWPTQSTNKWFPLKHGSQATEHNEKKNGIMKKKLKEEQTTNLLFRPTHRQIHTPFVSFVRQTIQMEWRKKNCTQTHTKTQCHKKIGRIKTKTTPYIYISDGREHLHNSIEYPNFFLYLFLVLCARAELKWAKQSSDFLAQLWFDIDCTRTCASL